MASATCKIISVGSSTCTIAVKVDGLTNPGSDVFEVEETYHDIIVRYTTNGVYTPPFELLNIGTIYYPATSGNLTAAIPKTAINGTLIFRDYYFPCGDGGNDGAYDRRLAEIPINYTLPAPSSISYSSTINSYYNTTISWAAVPGADLYTLESQEDNSGTWSYRTAIAGTSYNPYIPQSASRIQFRVKASMGTVSKPSPVSSYVTGSVSNVYYTPPNAVPTVPSTITVPAQIRGGSSVAISWGSSTDSDGNLSGYQLERATNGGAFSSIYRGSNRSYSDTAGADWSTVQYRVRAYDTYSAYSGYKTGNVINVVQNTPPVISGANSNLGAKTGAFNQPYSVTDADSGQTITVVEKIDAKQKRSFTATSGAQYSIGVSAAEWIEILNGSHTLTITATDSYGSSVSRTYTFSKNETAIELQLVTPLPSDERILRAIMNVTRTIPVTSIFTVEACNNGYDTTPTWVNVTDSVLSGNKFFFANTSKTASKWGYNFKIKVQRNSASGDCYIQGIGGNFD